MSKKVIVSGVGCVLVDRLFNNIDFNSAGFARYLSKESGDGGLIPGQLVFVEEFEQFAKEEHQFILDKITNGRENDKINVGGPSIVSLIHASQLLCNIDCELRFYGGRGDDLGGEFILKLLENTSLNIENYIVTKGETPSTFVLSDPSYNNNRGERIFINSIGAAWNYSEQSLTDDFFSSDVVIYGGTALVPQIHDSLTGLLEKAKMKGCITIVNTVYDFRNQKMNPNKKWPLGNSDRSYGYIDLLITDLEEAYRLSGKENIEEAIEFFREQGTGALIVTSGADNVRFFSQGKLFEYIEYGEMPIPEVIAEDLKNGKGRAGDTTGCGDNFVGGVIASIVLQLQDKSLGLKLADACYWGGVSGGTACYYMGGVFEEKSLGEKRRMIEPYYKQYKQQIEG